MTQELAGKPGKTEPVSVPDKQSSIDNSEEANQANPARPREIGGPRGLEPTRYGDWETNGRCSDF